MLLTIPSWLLYSFAVFGAVWLIQLGSHWIRRLVLYHLLNQEEPKPALVVQQEEAEKYHNFQIEELQQKVIEQQRTNAALSAEIKTLNQKLETTWTKIVTAIQ